MPLNYWLVTHFSYIAMTGWDETGLAFAEATECFKPYTLGITWHAVR